MNTNNRIQRTVDLKSLFMGLQGQLTAELNLVREVIPHNGDMGNASENKWREMLTKHLPTRYLVRKGIVVDSNGRCSDSIDIVIFDRHFTNLLMEEGGQLFIPAESVYAIFETKQSISKDHILYSGEKAASVRRLHRTSAPIFHAEGIAPPKQPIPILAGLICLDSTWSPIYGESFNKAIESISANPETRLDLGCCVSKGSFEAIYTESSTNVEVSNAENGLIFFLLRLMKRLQQHGTVSAIDFSSYEKWLD